MSFRVTGLQAETFSHLRGLSDETLASLGAIRRRADSKPGFPDRIALRDAEVGETVLLVNYLHQPAQTPYRASHAIYVIESEENTFDAVDVVPPALRPRTLSLRAFDAGGMLVDADLAEGEAMGSVAERLLANPRVAYVHAHYARMGCYAARIERA